jgi:hypothetical protein
MRNVVNIYKITYDLSDVKMINLLRSSMEYSTDDIGNPIKTREEAIYIIIRFLRKLVLNKRMNAFRSYKGCLYSRKY